MKYTFRSISSTTTLIGLASFGMSAWGQEPPPVESNVPSSAVQQTESIPEESDSGSSKAPENSKLIIVTGSYIRGTPLDAALPVEVYSQQELEYQGAPSALEFAKSLTISGPTTGESYYFGGPALTGSVNYNLRGLGADKTLILLNGRRGSQNTSNIPSIALDRTEILKDGAAVIYGADATGGVVNFITKDRFVGLEMSSQYKYIDGSDGDYSIAILGGFGEDKVNFMWSAEYEHRSRLHTLDRDFTHQSLDPTISDFNPAPWSTLSNLTGWVPRGSLPAIPDATADGEFGAAVGGIISDFTQDSCSAVGGRYDNSFTCAYNYIQFYNLVEDNDIYRIYSQLNADINNSTKFHLEASFGKVSVPQVFGSPAQPIIRGPALAPGLVNQFYAPISNPYAAAFASDHGVVGASGFTPITYRLLAHGGNQYFGKGNGYGMPDVIDNKVWRVSANLNGSLGDLVEFGQEINYDFALTYNRSSAYNTHPDTIGFRLQEALNGFGGPNCNAVDLDASRFGTQNPGAAGQNGCSWWNPFSSSFANQPIRNLANPNYVPGSENSEELTRWMFDPRGVETITNNFTADLVFNGMSGLELTGGYVGWAVGAQFRETENREVVDSPIFNGSLPCPWPDGFTSANGTGSANLESTPYSTDDPRFRGCTPDLPGSFVLFAINPPNRAKQKQRSFFGELNIPILDSVNLQTAVRHEKFTGDLSATVYKIAGKWEALDELSFRGSYGTNYQTPPIGVTPGAVTVGARTYTVAASNWLAAQFITDANLKPETAKSWNVGAIWQSDGFIPAHKFRFIFDYFDIQTEDQIGEIADPNQIASLVFNGVDGTITTCDSNVQPLLNRITFNNGCTVGMSAVGAFSSVSTRFGNGPGQSTNGLDVQASYEMPVGSGNLSLSLAATLITELETGATELDGVVVSTADDRLGFLNFATFAQAAPKMRANLNANYNLEQQNFRLAVNYVSAVEDERDGIQYGEEGENWITANFTYRYQFSDTLALSTTLANIFDRDPPPAQEEFGYDPWMANPLGRTVEVAIKMSF